MFDIDFVTKNFGVCAPGRYLEKFENASNDELHKFKKKIINHRKHNKQQQAFGNIKNYSTHKALISAVNYELLKRSKLYKFYKVSFPVRKWLIGLRNGSELTEHKYLGTLCSQPKHVKYVWHMTCHELLKTPLSFCCNNWSKIIMAICAIGTFILMFLMFKER